MTVGSLVLGKFLGVLGFVAVMLLATVQYPLGLTQWVMGSLAVATLATCALFATATGIVGAVVTLMGLLALPPMLRAGYDVRLATGVIAAGGCLGILIPPSIMLILYGATAGVSVVQLYAAAFIPGVMLASLYILYAMGIAVVKPSVAPSTHLVDGRPSTRSPTTAAARKAATVCPPPRWRELSPLADRAVDAVIVATPLGEQVPVAHREEFVFAFGPAHGVEEGPVRVDALADLDGLGFDLDGDDDGDAIPRRDGDGGLGRGEGRGRRAVAVAAGDHERQTQSGAGSGDATRRQAEHGTSS